MYHKIKQFNETVAIKTTLIVSTMACVYLFILWSLLPLAFPSIQAMVFYVSGGILQLVLLPVIMVGQSILNRNSEQRAEQDHLAIMATLHDIQTLIGEEQTVIEDEDKELIDLTEINERLIRIEKLIKTPAAAATLREGTGGNRLSIERLKEVVKAKPKPRKTT